MKHSRRAFLMEAAGATVGIATLGMPEWAGATTRGKPEWAGATCRESGKRIVNLFAKLPGDVAFRVVSPATHGKRQLDVALNPSSRLFVGSAFKGFVLGEYLRQADSPNVVQTITDPDHTLALDASVWSPDSATFNPPHLTGAVTKRTALEAMILHSDNTGTDMCMKDAGVDNVRAFIASAGLTNTLIPESTRSFIGYLLGAPDYKTFTWEQVVAAANDSIVNPPLNTVQTLASSADDLVSYYSRALQGEFFAHDETLHEFRRILTIADAIYLVPFPLGVSAFAKGGSIDIPGFHAVCVAGAMFFDDQWVYFSFTINWDAAAETDPTTVGAFADAVSQTLDIVKKSLAT